MVRTLQSPFDSANKRMRNYYFFIFLSPLALMVIIFIKSSQPVPSEYIEYNIVPPDQQGKGDLQYTRNLMMLMVFTGFMFSAFFSVIFACKRLGRDGINTEARF